MNSVFLVGEAVFAAAVRSHVRGLDSLAVSVLSDAKTAQEQIDLSGPPAVVVVQSTSLTAGSIAKTFERDQSIYFIVVEFAGGDRSLSGRYEDSERILEKTAIALEAGADAYVHLSHQMVDRADGAGKKEEQSGRLAQLPRPVIKLSSIDCRLLQAHIHVGIDRAQRYRDLSRINDWLSAIALVDALTQLSNRRAFDMELPNQVQMARAKNVPLSLMVVDIDFFKSVNDRYGHLVGDEVLKLMAQRLMANMRFYDTPFRYGGEEFVVILSNTDLAEGRAIAQRLRQLIEADPFLPSLLKAQSNEALPLTVSIGVTALLPEDDADGVSFLNRADQHLLLAKQAGRNCVEGGE